MPKRKQVVVRLAPASLEHLEKLKAFYGLRSTTAVVAVLIADATRHLPAEPLAQPFMASEVVVVQDEQDENDIDAQQFRRQVARTIDQ
jgi:hypothetical protein